VPGFQAAGAARPPKRVPRPLAALNDVESKATTGALLPEMVCFSASRDLGVSATSRSVSGDATKPALHGGDKLPASPGETLCPSKITD